MQRSPATLLFLGVTLLGFMPSPSSADELTYKTIEQCRDERDAAKRKAATAPGGEELFETMDPKWYRYCEVRNHYLDLVIMGRASEADATAATEIEEERTQCLQRASVPTQVDLNDPEVRKILTGLRDNALPRLREQMGEELGTKEFERRAKIILAALASAEQLGRQDQCYKDAIQAYKMRVSTLSE